MKNSLWLRFKKFTKSKRSIVDFILVHLFVIILLLVSSGILETALAQSISTAKITVNVVTSDNNQAVHNFKAELSINGQLLKTYFSGSGNTITFNNIPTLVENSQTTAPIGLMLKQNFPNPSYPPTHVPFNITKEGSVNIYVYDIRGRRVATIVNERLGPGDYEVSWSGTTDNGQPVAAGVYFYQLIANGQRAVNKMVNLGSGSGAPHLTTGINGSHNIEPKTVGSNGLHKNVVYTHELKIIDQPDSTRPRIYTQVIQFNLDKDTTILIPVARYLVPADLGALLSKSTNQGAFPADSLKQDLQAKMVAAFDSSGNPVSPDQVLYQIVSQSKPSLANFAINGNKYIVLKTMNSSANGSSTVTVKATAPNGQTDQESFTFTVNPNNYRMLTFNMKDYFLQTPIDSMYVVTALDSGFATGGKQFKAPLTDAKVLATKAGYFDRGMVIPAGTLNQVISDYTPSTDTSKQGIDPVYFGKLLSDFRQDGTIPSMFYVAPTSESLKDTIWIYARQLGGQTESFDNVDQLNAIAQFFNTSAKELTTTLNNPNGLFGESRNIIAIADNNFNNPESIAKFQYSNMKVVPENSAPIALADRQNYFIVQTRGGLAAANAVYLRSDNKTIKGGVLIISNKGSYAFTKDAMDDEAASMLMGGTESSINYPSIQDGRYNIFFPHDIRMGQWVTFLGPGAQYPALSKGF